MDGLKQKLFHNFKVVLEEEVISSDSPPIVTLNFDKSQNAIIENKLNNYGIDFYKVKTEGFARGERYVNLSDNIKHLRVYFNQNYQVSIQAIEPLIFFFVYILLTDGN